MNGYDFLDKHWPWSGFWVLAVLLVIAGAFVCLFWSFKS